jgi:predicted RNA-binding protein with PUA-like domain
VSAHFLIKSEPFKYSFDKLVKDGRTTWDGVRNFEARNHLRSMKVGDLCLFYHSNEGKAVVGIAKVLREAFPDPTAKDGDWSVVDVGPVMPLAVPVTLETMRETPGLEEIKVVTRPRLSVMPVTAKEFATVLRLGKTKLPK